MDIVLLVSRLHVGRVGPRGQVQRDVEVVNDGDVDLDLQLQTKGRIDLAELLLGIFSFPRRQKRNTDAIITKLADMEPEVLDLAEHEESDQVGALSSIILTLGNVKQS